MSISITFPILFGSSVQMYEYDTQKEREYVLFRDTNCMFLYFSSSKISLMYAYFFSSRILFFFFYFILFRLFHILYIPFKEIHNVTFCIIHIHLLDIYESKVYVCGTKLQKYKKISSDRRQWVPFKVSLIHIVKFRIFMFFFFFLHFVICFCVFIQTIFGPYLRIIRKKKDL